MEFNVRAKNPFYLTHKNDSFQVESHLLLEPAPEGLDDRIVNTFDKPIHRIDFRVNVWRNNVSEWSL